MSEKNQEIFVIADGDEGVQLNSGRRLAALGAGFHLPHFDQVSSYLKKLFGKKLAVVSNAENAWFKQELNLDDWEQVDAISMQHVEALADKHNLLYAGFLPFADPKALNYGVKGHMVRPKKIHLANKICFSLGGGEQTFNLGHFVISADWVHLASDKVIKEFIQPQIDFYASLVGKDKLEVVYETKGILPEEIAQKNLKILKRVGLI